MSKSLQVTLSLPSTILPEIQWSWDLFCSYHHIPYKFTSDDPDLRIGMASEDDIKISSRFEEMYRTGRFQHQKVFPDTPLIQGPNEEPDLLGTVFYMVNCLQEYEATEGSYDKWGRFQFSSSYQARFDCIEEDLVGHYLHQLWERLPVLKEKGFTPRNESSAFFLTHDIDRINRGEVREFSHALKTRNLHSLSLLFSYMARGKRVWDNLSELSELHHQYGLCSTYFWLTKKGISEDGIRNADYEIDTPTLKKARKIIRERGSANGLHKSCSPTSFEKEFSTLDHAIKANRNHYLKFSLPSHFEALEKAGFFLDASLGFPEAVGFRNSYALPFQPFHFQKRRKMRLWEVPLPIMDVTLFSQKRDPAEKILTFFEKHSTNSLITILWHNNYLTPLRFKPYLEAYKKVLAFLQENNIRSFTPEEIPTHFSEGKGTIS